MPHTNQGGYADDNTGLLTHSYGGGSPDGYGPSGYGPGHGNAGYNPGGGYPGAAGLGGVKVMGAGSHVNDVYFAAAMCVVIGALLGGTSLFFAFKAVDWLGMSYLMLFGLALAMLDTPFLKSVKFVAESKMYIGKYVQFVTRVTGKGVTLIFLGSTLFLMMWNTNKGGFMRFLAVILSLFPAMVGLASVVVGTMKSSNLEKVRRNLEPIIEQQYDQHALRHRGPNGGLTMTEFNDMTEKNCPGVHFEPLDLKLIFNALVSDPSWRMAQSGQQAGGLSDEMGIIPRQDVLDWCRGGRVLL